MSCNKKTKMRKTSNVRYGSNIRSQSNTSYGSNKLSMNEAGVMRPELPARTFSARRDIITPPTTNMNSAPLFYIGPRVNVLWSSTSPDSPLAIGVMRFGNNNYSLHDVFGNNKNVKGQALAKMKPNLNLNVDYNRNVKLVDLAGKSHRVYSNEKGNYVRYNNKSFYL